VREVVPGISNGHVITSGLIQIASAICPSSCMIALTNRTCPARPRRCSRRTSIECPLH
jgi:hypothetical protein